MKINSINNFVIQPVRSVKPSNSIRQIPDFTDYIYKLEQNIKNELTADENIKNRNISAKNHPDVCLTSLEQFTSNSIHDDKNKKIYTKKLYELLMLSCNLKKSVFNYLDQLHLNKHESRKDFTPLKDYVSVVKSYKKITYQEAEENLKEIRNSIIDFSSPAAILNASYLLSASIVFPLLNAETIEYSDGSDDD